MSQGVSRNPDDDCHLKRTGTVWTASAYITTAVMGSGVLSSSWAISQLGWIAGPILMLLFSFLTHYTSTLLASSYRSGDLSTGPRKNNTNYMDVVRDNLGGFQSKICGAAQYSSLFAGVIGYTISSSLSMKAIQGSSCFRSQGVDSPCKVSTIPCLIAFGAVEIILSQIPNYGQIWWLSIVSAFMSLIYSTIGLGLAIAKIAAEGGEVRGSLTGISVGRVTATEKIIRFFQAIGSLMFAHSYSLVLVEIQDTIKSPPSEFKTMKKAILQSSIIATIFHMLCGCFGYAAFGDLSPENLLTGFGFYNLYWLLDIANAAIIIHHIGGYQVYCQPIFAFIEKTASKCFPHSKFINEDITIQLPGFKTRYELNPFRLVWRCIFVIITTIISTLVLSLNIGHISVVGAPGLWRLTVHYPVAIYISQKEIPKWSKKWTCLQILSMCCLLISVAAAAGSLAGVVYDLKAKLDS